MICEMCDGSGVLYVWSWAYAREDGKGLDWVHDDPRPTSCHGCEAGLGRLRGGLL